MSDKLEAVGVSKHWLLLPAKLRMTELNAWKNMALRSTFRKIWHRVQPFAACATTVFVLKYMSV